MARTRRDPRAARSTARPGKTAEQLVRALALYRTEARANAERWLEAERDRDDTSRDFRYFYEDAPLGYIRFDRAGTIRQINKVAAAMLGRAIASLVGKPLLPLVDRMDRGVLLRHLMRCRAGEPLVTSVVRLLSDALRVAQLVTTHVHRRGREPSDALFDTILTDVSEQTATVRALEESERRYRTIVETANEGICIVDADDHIKFFNGRFARMVGAADEQIDDMLLADFIADPQSDRPTLRSTTRDIKRRRVFELRLRRLDGREFWTSVSPSVIVANDDDVGLLYMFTDITDRKELEASRDQLMRHLVAAQEAERRRIARELHDGTGQHLVGLTLGLNQLGQLDGVSPEMKGVVARLKAISDGLSRDVHRLAVELRPAALDDLGLSVAVSNFADAMSQQFGLQVDVHCAVARRLDPVIETTVYRVVQEALTNVVRHAHARQVSIIIESQPTALRAVVEDDGVGFDVNRRRSGTTEGRLGIAGMRERATLVGGDLAIESSDGQGTTVFLRVPLGEGTNDDEKNTPAPRG